MDDNGDRDSEEDKQNLKDYQLPTMQEKSSSMLTSVMTIVQSSRPVALILKREYILIATTMMATGTSVHSIAIKDLPLSWSPPFGAGSEAILILNLLSS